MRDEISNNLWKTKSDDKRAKGYKLSIMKTLRRSKINSPWWIKKKKRNSVTKVQGKVGTENRWHD